MSNSKSNRGSATSRHGSRVGIRNSADRKHSRKPAKPKPSAKAAPASRRDRDVARQGGRPNSKQARIIAMLRDSSGATIDAMIRATGWQPHSVRGFLAAVVRKKLGLNLVSAAAEGGRIYRIDDRPIHGPANKKA